MSNVLCVLCKFRPVFSNGSNTTLHAVNNKNVEIKGYCVLVSLPTIIISNILFILL